MSAQRTIVIVGGGYSGALTAVHLLRSAGAASLRVILIERRSRFARGLAYHTWDDNLLLNVPAGNMSALADEPGHFADYLRNIDPAFTPGSFVSRRIYGDYLEDTLAAAEAAAPGALERRSGSVSAVHRDPGPGALRVALADGTTLPADEVVLALGHFAPGNLAPTTVISDSGAYVANPWNTDAIDRADPARAVAILGAGHTAMDVLFRLTSTRSTREVVLISRRGLLPHGHRFTPKAPSPAAAYPAFLQGVAPTVRAYARAIIREARSQAQAGADWRDTMNALRPHTPALWQSLDDAGRHRFLRRLLPWWDIHRHRLAPTAARRLDQLLRSGRVRVLAAQLQSTARVGNELQLTLRPRGAIATREITVGTVINCTGPAYDVAALAEPLVIQLRNAGLICPDPLRIGIAVDARYRVLGPDGGPTPGLYYVGPMLKSRYWEAIAVPELRGHVQRLGRQLSGREG
jgi:uncharacterized NAD(P)/FAD-binding protein YdhS